MYFLVSSICTGLAATSIVPKSSPLIHCLFYCSTHLVTPSRFTYTPSTTPSHPAVRLCFHSLPLIPLHFTRSYRLKSTSQPSRSLFRVIRFQTHALPPLQTHPSTFATSSRVHFHSHGFSYSLKVSYLYFKDILRGFRIKKRVLTR